MATAKEATANDPVTAAHEKWFYNIDPKQFIELTKAWNNRNLEIKLKRKKNYDDWLNYFKTLSVNQLKLLSSTGLDILPAEAYAALSFWRDIMENPSRIYRVHQAGLTNRKTKKGGGSIIELAQNNDRLGVLKATRDKIAEQLDKGAGRRDTAALVREMTEVMSQIAEVEKKAAPKQETMLGRLLGDMPSAPDTQGKRQRGKGSRGTSFKSRVTIDDIEATDE